MILANPPCCIQGEDAGFVEVERAGSRLPEIICDEVVAAIEEVRPSFTPRRDPAIIWVAVPLGSLRFRHPAMRPPLGRFRFFVVWFRFSFGLPT